jgi:prephenate dehydratase
VALTRERAAAPGAQAAASRVRAGASRARTAAAAIAYQGEPGAYGEEAVLGYFGEDAVEPSPTPTFTAVCHAVADGRVAAALLPLENSIAGTVGEALDALVRAELTVVGECLLPVRHQLLGAPGTSLAEIRTVTSHVQALAQCEAYVAAHGWEMVVAMDTAAAARRLAETSDEHLAVIASERAARRYGLTILASDIQGGPNVTRFAVVARGPDVKLPAAAGPLAPPPTAPRVSLILFETRHVAGALHDALGAFADAGVSLNRIESRPTGRRTWEYRFVASVDGDHENEPLKGALDALQRRAHAVRVLGSYPSAG